MAVEVLPSAHDTRPLPFEAAIIPSNLLLNVAILSSSLSCFNFSHTHLAF